jgi:4a-hydroxytetrahydrobiopterin dehydratase
MNTGNTQLEKEQIEAFLADNPHWKLVDNALQANFVFADFADVMAVVNQVAQKAEEQQHHPFWSNEYNKLAFVLSTHDAGDVVTEKDTRLAEAISLIVQG